MCVAKEAIFHINVQIERILIQKKMRVVIIHLKKTRRRKVRVERRVRARISYTLFYLLRICFQFQVEYILREFLERV